jgi:transposase-like protein
MRHSKKKKTEAVKRVLAGERAVDIAKEMKVKPQNIYNWVRKAKNADTKPAQKVRSEASEKISITKGEMDEILMDAFDLGCRLQNLSLMTGMKFIVE